MFTFNKTERLKKRKDIEALFSSGIKIKEHPILFIYSKRGHDDDTPLKVAFSVSKKSIKSAVKRNRIKRQMREIYRLQKNEVFKKLNNSKDVYAGMLIYTGEDMPESNIIKEKIIVILERYIADIERHIV